MNICKLKIGDTYISNNNIYQIVVPFKPSIKNPRICFGLSRFIGVVDNDSNIIKKQN